VEEVRAEALGTDHASRLDNTPAAAIRSPQPPVAGLERVADVPIYATDPIVRRAPSLQATADAADPVVGLPPGLFAQFGPRVRVHQGAASATLPAREDPTLAPGAVRIAAGHPLTASLGPMFGGVSVERVEGSAA
jgi:NADH-quinone oxidoreductase subunit G